MTSTKLNDLLGNEFVQHSQSDNETNLVSTNQLHGKTIALYFSAHWCPPCRNFTPKLAKIFNELNDDIKNKFDIVFISSDRNQEDFNQYFKEMPWKALPFADRDRSKILNKKFMLKSIPTLVILSPSLEIVTLNGVDEIRCSSKEALQNWLEEKSLFWNCEPENNEYIWKNIFCNECFMKPLIGSRFGCINKKCKYNLCQKCFSKTKHEHSIYEYLIPNEKYSLEILLSSISDLINPINNEQIQTKRLFENNIKSIGFYFSASWFQPCRLFTHKLSEFYKQFKIDDLNTFEILFVSCDRDETSFNTYRLEMPWPAIPFNSTEIIKSYFQYTSIPTLVIVSLDGTILSNHARNDVQRYGIEALKTWSRAEKLIVSSQDQFIWKSISCKQCNMNPLIGQRYTCTICNNYDLCSICQTKGHQHELQLQIQTQSNDQHDNMQNLTQ